MRGEILFFKKQSVNELAKKAFLDRLQLVNFLLEQLIQLLLKYTLALSVGYFSKTHKLTHLFEEVFTVYPEFKRFYLENRDKIKIIEDSYLLSRYLGKDYRKEDVEDKFEVYERLKKLVEEHESS